MKKEDLTVPAIFAEAVGMILGIVYIGLQIYYGIAYKVAPYKFICNIAGVVLIYVGLSLVSCQPEKINRLPKGRVQSSGDCRYPCDHRVL